MKVLTLKTAVGAGLVILLLNIFAPTTTDVRVVKYVVPIVSQVRGRVIEVPVENNRPVKKGDVLFKIDPTPYQNEVHSLEAKLLADQAKVSADRQKMAEVTAKLTGTQKWTHDGQTFTRTCSGAIQRPLAAFLPKPKAPAQ